MVGFRSKSKVRVIEVRVRFWAKGWVMVRGEFKSVTTNIN